MNDCLLKNDDTRDCLFANEKCKGFSKRSSGFVKRLSPCRDRSGELLELSLLSSILVWIHEIFNDILRVEMCYSPHIYELLQRKTF